jgi:hypothetical protein
MRALAACSLGGAGHLRPLVPFLDEARRADGSYRESAQSVAAEMAATPGIEPLLGKLRRS